jgi:hypothetical protein
MEAQHDASTDHHGKSGALGVPERLRLQPTKGCIPSLYATSSYVPHSPPDAPPKHMLLEFMMKQTISTHMLYLVVPQGNIDGPEPRRTLVWVISVACNPRYGLQGPTVEPPRLRP